MPYIGQDWRSSGDQWVRTAKGWETTRLCQVNENSSARSRKRVLVDKLDNHANYEPATGIPKNQPFIVFSSKEKHGFTSFSDAIIRLDMSGAVKDIRRANYMAKILFIVLRKLPELSGTSQKLVLNVVETMVNEAMKTEFNIALMKKILLCAHDSLKEGKRRHIGSQSLWLKHIQAVDRLTERVANYQIKERKKDGKIMLSDLPTDCLRHIFSRISDHKDVLRAGQTSFCLNELSEDSHLWKKLCLYHFSSQNIFNFHPSGQNSTTLNWKYIYKTCYKQYGIKDYYPDMLSVCCQCSKIFWKRLGHPCFSDEECEVKELTPEEFMSLLKL